MQLAAIDLVRLNFALCLADCCLAIRRHYFNNTDGLIFVVDSADRDRINRAAQEFKSIIEDPLMKTASILVFANKQVQG
jgi:GTPase SAR1 family protein